MYSVTTMGSGLVGLAQLLSNGIRDSAATIRHLLLKELDVMAKLFLLLCVSVGSFDK